MSCTCSKCQNTGCSGSGGCAAPSSCCNDPCAQQESQSEETTGTCCSNTQMFVRAVTGFNMPACDETGVITLDDASRLFPGAILWIQGVGYLEVVSVDDDCQVTVRNNCPSCNEGDPGTPVPEDTQIGVGIPPCIDEGEIEFTGPRLASDFIIPNVGNCVTVAVTTIEGLTVGDTVEINGNRYVINSIPTTSTIEICNEGEGGTPGILVQADPDNDGVFNHPIIVVSSVNPCTEDPVSAGRIIVCTGADAQRAVEGTVFNQVLAWNPDTSQFELKVIDDLLTCVSLDCNCLTLDPEDDPCDDYIIPVVPNTDNIEIEFDKTQPNPLKIYIDNDLFCVTEVIDDTQLRVVPSFEITEFKTYPEDAVICVAECCEQCQPTIYTMDRQGDPLQMCVDEILVTTGGATIIATPGVTTHTFPGSLAINNQSGFEGGADYMWEIVFNNDSCCDCQKYVETTSNYEMALTSPEGVDANIEVRILKTAPLGNSQAFAGHFFPGGQSVLVGAQAADLISGFQTLNTHKGTVFDRDFVAAGDSSTYRGHIRVVINNTTGSNQNVGIVVNWRAWIKAWDYGCADVVTDIPTYP